MWRHIDTDEGIETVSRIYERELYVDNIIKHSTDIQVNKIKVVKRTPFFLFSFFLPLRPQVELLV